MLQFLVSNKEEAVVKRRNVMYLASKGICPLLCRDVYQTRLRRKKCCAKALEVFPTQLSNITYPLAITMWDFSWLERRRPGARYEDWHLILDELKPRRHAA